MRHQRRGRKLNRSASHRKAFKANLATSILDKERVTTTVAKAKEVRSVVERLITYGKRGGLSNIRIAARTIKNEDVLKKLFTDIAPGYNERTGGYTRVLKLSPRQGDNADMAIIELVGRRGEEPRKKPKRKKTSVRRKPKAGIVDTTAVQTGETPQPATDASPGTVEMAPVDTSSKDESAPQEVSEKESGTDGKTDETSDK